MKDHADTLRTHPIWMETYAIVEYMYGQLEEIIAKFPDERWMTASKLRSSANESMFYVSLAVGSALPYATDYEWNSARKNLFALQAEYIFANTQGFVVLDSQIIARIDNLLQQISDQLDSAKKASKAKDREDLEPWLEKYRLWKEMGSK